MFKRAFLWVISTFFCLTGYGQDLRTIALVGRWRCSEPNFKSDLVFINENQAYWASVNGLITNRLQYSLVSKKGRSSIRYTFDLHSEKKRYRKAGIQQLNDSTLLYKSESDIPRNADTTKKRLLVFKKISYRASDFHKPSYSDLIGDWKHYFKGGMREGGLTFKDSVSAVLTNSMKTENFSYKVDFSRQPITVDFYNSETTLPAFIGFMDDVNMRLELFPNQDRGDRFKVFGRNFWMKKVSAGSR